MKKKFLGSSLIVLLALVVAGPANAALEQQPSDLFRNPSGVGVINALLPAFINIPLDQSAGLIGCLGGDLSIGFAGTVSVDDPGFGIFWDGEGLVPLVLEGGATDLIFDGDLYLEADGCLWGLVDGTWNFYSPEASVEQMYIGFITTPFLDTATDTIVLETRGDSVFWIAGLELLPDLFGLEEFVEPLLVSWINDLLTSLLNDGDLATPDDGGVLHDMLEAQLDKIYIPHTACGCITLTQGTPDAGHLLANMAFYMIPVGLIFGLRRWTKR